MHSQQYWRVMLCYEIIYFIQALWEKIWNKWIILSFLSVSTIYNFSVCGASINTHICMHLHADIFCVKNMGKSTRKSITGGLLGVVPKWVFRLAGYASSQAPDWAPEMIMNSPVHRCFCAPVLGNCTLVFAGSIKNGKQSKGQPLHPTSEDV